MADFWSEMAAPGPEAVVVQGVTLRRGSRVRLPAGGGRHLMDTVLGERVAIVESIEEDAEGKLHLAVALEDDPGRDLGEGRFPAHRFFFTPEEVQPLDQPGAPAPRRILVAGIGNVFLGDDGFGVEVVRALAARRAPPGAGAGTAETAARPGVDVVDFGIRGMDLVFALQRDYDAAILVDAAPRGEAPGTISVLEPRLESGADDVAPAMHAVDPVRALRMARALGGIPGRTLVVACEPGVLPDLDAGEILMELSPPVRAAVEPALLTIETLLDELVGGCASAPPPAQARNESEPRTREVFP